MILSEIWNFMAEVYFHNLVVSFFSRVKMLERPFLCLFELTLVEYGTHSNTWHNMKYKNQISDYHNPWRFISSLSLRV